jgi:hypothetical protein
MKRVSWIVLALVMGLAACGSSKTERGVSGGLLGGGAGYAVGGPTGAAVGGAAGAATGVLTADDEEDGN